MVKKIRKKGARRVRPGRGRQTPGRGGGLPAHGQKTRWLKGLSGGWRRAWQVVVDPGTDNTVGRLKERYTWAADKYELSANEVTPVGACIITFDFKPVPKHAGGGGHDIQVRAKGYYSGNHASPSLPKFQIYDHVGTDWEDITGMVFSSGGTEYEQLEGRVPFDAKYFDGDNNVRVRIFHPNVAGNTSHEFHVNQVGLGTYGTTTTTSTTSTTTTV